MPRHSPTRRNRRVGGWERAREDGLSPDAFDLDLDLDLEVDLAADLDPGVLPDEDDAIWRPARRDSRLPSWMPPWMQRTARISLRVAIVSCCLLVATILFYFVLSFRYDVQEINAMPEHSIIFDMRGKELATLHGESRRLITREEIPQFFVEALQAREDQRFYKHSGIDIFGLVRATGRNVKDLSFTQGASTLTMQLARNSFELRDKSLHRKLLEMALAVRIEGSYSKNEILTSYTNRIYFGSGTHGLEEASRRYFGVSAADLNDNQCALLAGIIRAPHTYSPHRDLQRALQQRDEVLARMVAEKFVTESEAKAVAELPLDLRTPGQATNGNAALQAVRRHFEELIAKREIRDGGLRLRSTIHGEIQKMLEEETIALLPKIPDGAEIAVICLKVPTGAIRGIVGGRTPEATSFNRALDARRDLGPVFTPFIYAAAAERGIQPLLDQPLRTGREIGHSDLVGLAERFGFAGPFQAGDDLFRGGLSATPLEVATAAATLTNGGNRPRTHFIKDLRDSELTELFKTEPSLTPAFDPRSAAAALAMQFPDGELQFPDREPRLLSGSNASKTDVWAISFGSQHAICLWIGHDKPRRLDASDTIVAEAHNTVRRMALSLPLNLKP